MTLAKDSMTLPEVKGAPRLQAARWAVDSAMVSAVIVFVVLLVMASAPIVYIVTPEAGARGHAEANNKGRDLDDLQADSAHDSLRRETFLLVPMTGCMPDATRSCSKKSAR
jgi:hypothetical protein